MHELPLEHAAFLYVYEGALRVGASAGPGSEVTLVREGELAVLGQGTRVQLRGDSNEAAGPLRTAAGALRADADLAHSAAIAGDGKSRAILVAGQPLREPVARHGPFVMNTREQVLQAISDFRSGRF